MSLPLTESQADQVGLGDRWRIARKKIASRRQHRADAAARLDRAVQTLLRHAQTHSKPWSQRRLAKQIGLSWPSWLRCRRGQVNARRWVTRLESAIARLSPS